MSELPDILTRIVQVKREEIAAAKRSIGAAELLARAEALRPTVSLGAALRARPFAVIAEMKRSSPSAGALATFSPADLAAAYQRGGAAAISVLTDGPFFGGSLQDLAQARAAATLPLLRKDFILDAYQLAQARAYGADAVLLIARLLERAELADLHAQAAAMGLECLVELHDEAELERVDFGAMKLVGINNRDLRTLRVSLDQTLRIAPLIPADVTVVSESGVRNARDLALLARHGVRAALVGEAFMRATDPAEALRELLSSFPDAEGAA